MEGKTKFVPYPSQKQDDILVPTMDVSPKITCLECVYTKKL